MIADRQVSTMAQAYLEEYVLHRYKTLTTARARVEHLRGSFGGWRAEAITPDSIREYQKHRREAGAEASTVNRETSGLSRMFQLAIHRGQLERMPLFPKRLEENLRRRTCETGHSFRFVFAWRSSRSRNRRIL